ncbi:ROK family protein OS=Streptomyces alboniger OX=132473 GN=CP975_04055 PE=3 SV=1 [Streptomyces alboniger]
MGAGLAAPSAVAEPEGTALNPLHLAWPAGAQVRQIFTDCVRDAKIAGPAFAANDVNLAALAEHRHGAVGWKGSRKQFWVVQYKTWA